MQNIKKVCTQKLRLNKIINFHCFIKDKKKRNILKKSSTFSKYLGTLVVSSLASSIVTIRSPQPAQLAIHGICVRNAITGSPVAIFGKITLRIHTLSTGSACYWYLGGKWKSCSMGDYPQFLTEEKMRCAWLQRVPYISTHFTPFGNPICS